MRSRAIVPLDRLLRPVERPVRMLCRGDSLQKENGRLLILGSAVVHQIDRVGRAAELNHVDEVPILQ